MPEPAPPVPPSPSPYAPRGAPAPVTREQRGGRARASRGRGGLSRGRGWTQPQISAPSFSTTGEPPSTTSYRTDGIVSPHRRRPSAPDHQNDQYYSPINHTTSNSDNDGSASSRWGRTHTVSNWSAPQLNQPGERKSFLKKRTVDSKGTTSTGGMRERGRGRGRGALGGTRSGRSDSQQARDDSLLAEIRNKINQGVKKEHEIKQKMVESADPNVRRTLNLQLEEVMMINETLRFTLKGTEQQEAAAMAAQGYPPEEEEEEETEAWAAPQRPQRPPQRQRSTTIDPSALLQRPQVIPYKAEESYDDTSTASEEACDFRDDSYYDYSDNYGGEYDENVDYEEDDIDDSVSTSPSSSSASWAGAHGNRRHSRRKQLLGGRDPSITNFRPPPLQHQYTNLNISEMNLVVKSELQARIQMETERGAAMRKRHTAEKDKRTKKELAMKIEESDMLILALQRNLKVLDGVGVEDSTHEDDESAKKKEKVKHLAEFRQLIDIYLKDFEGGYMDLLTGMLLLAKYYKTRPPRSEVVVADVNEIGAGFRYMRFAAAAYGIMLSALKMRKKALQYFAGNTEYTKGIGDVQPLGRDKPVVFDHLKDFLTEEDFIDGCWDVTRLGFLPGYFIALDREKKKVVLALRGSTNHHDWMTDLCGAGEVFLCGEAHRGMLHSSRELYARVGHTLLDQLQRNPGYGLIVCGHSLGGGVSSLFTLLFHDKHPEVNIHGYCYACPATVNTRLSLECRDIITTYAVGDDIVPRISIGSLEDLRETITFFCQEGGGNNMARLMGAIGMKNQKKLKRKARELEEVQAERDLGDRLVPPGSVFHFVRRDDGHVEMEQTSFKPFMEIIISQTMFTDHMPYVYEKAFKSTLGLRMPKTAKEKAKERDRLAAEAEKEREREERLRMKREEAEARERELKEKEEAKGWVKRQREEEKIEKERIKREMKALQKGAKHGGDSPRVGTVSAAQKPNTISSQTVISTERPTVERVTSSPSMKMGKTSSSSKAIQIALSTDGDAPPALPPRGQDRRMPPSATFGGRPSAGARGGGSPAASPSASASLLTGRGGGRVPPSSTFGGSASGVPATNGAVSRGRGGSATARGRGRGSARGGYQQQQQQEQQPPPYSAFT